MSTLSPAAAPALKVVGASPQPPSPNSQGGTGLRVRRWIFATLTGRAVLRPVFAVLRRIAPLAKLGKRVVVSRHADVVAVLDRDGDFTISQVNGPSIDRINGPFILAMDRGPEYDRDHAALRQCARREDAERVRLLARHAAERAVAAALPKGRIEAVQRLTRAVPAEMVEIYFGFPGPDRPTLERWLRTLFQDAFANPINDPFVAAAAAQSFAEIKAWAPAHIARRRTQGTGDCDDVLGRMIALGGPERPWADDDWVRRNIAGLVVGAVDTISRFSILAVDELLRRPGELRGAQDAARSGDLDAVRQYAWEAVRFNPHTPLMARFCPAETTIAAGTRRERKVPAGTSMLIGTLSAMFDPDGFPEPRRFRLDRDVRSYLHFGWGMHQCFGLGINLVVIPEIVAALLRLPGLRRARGAEGRVALDGPFPERLVLEFDRA
ncbi:MAG TPA: cytochrome P450 [Longimicrobium sp.]|nr:cytochrome P450 [Longimicrobium sp.]